MEDVEYAGFWIRVAAALIDTVVFVVVISIPLTFIYGADYWTTQTGVKGFWDILFQYVLPVVLTIWFWTRYLGTPGKMLLRLAVFEVGTLKEHCRTSAHSC